MIAMSIKVDKLDKSRFIKGEKGIYCNLILIETPNSAYGDYMVKQDMSKEERESGKGTPILGNAKILAHRKTNEDYPRTSEPKPQKSYVDDDDPEDLPF